MSKALISISTLGCRREMNKRGSWQERKYHSLNLAVMESKLQGYQADDNTFCCSAMALDVYGI
jgi:hypothetical protein